MGDVIKFRNARLTGFIPDDLGQSNPHSPMHTSPLLQPGRDAGSIADVSARYSPNVNTGLIDFAKSGGPIIEP